MQHMIPAHELRDLVARWRLLANVENHDRFADELEAIIPNQTIDELAPTWTEEDLVGRVVKSQITEHQVQIVKFDSNNGIVTGWDLATQQMKDEPLGNFEFSPDDPQVTDGKLIIE